MRQVPEFVHVLVGLVLVASYLGLRIWVEADGSDRPTPTPPFDHARALADLDGRRGQTAAYRAALEDLASVCSNSRSHLSDMALTTRKLLQDRGTSESLLTILEGIRSSVPERAYRLDCADLGARWATTRLSRR